MLYYFLFLFFFFFSSRRRHTRCLSDWSSDVCSSDLTGKTAAPAIQVKSLRKSFGEQVVLNAITLEVAQGGTLAVLGRSGTGKSVLLKLIVGLQQPDAGSICIHGQEVAGAGLQRLNEIRL